MKKFVHTPEGVRDIYGKECLNKHLLQDKIHHNFKKFGYRDIETPTFEFFDVFGREIGTTPSKDLYKFFDKEGNTLVLRPDFTPSIGRCAAKYFMEEKVPVRLTYKGNTFSNTSSLQGKLRETTQMGVEFIGDDSVMADAEMIHLAVTSLLAAGLNEFQISIGDVEYLKGICREHNFDDDIENELRTRISAKNYFAVEELLENEKISDDKVKAILKLTELFGSADILDEALGLVDNDKSKAAINRLKELYELIKLYGDEKYVSFDLGLVSNYHYYTGIIFKGYTYGVGDCILTGGRYNSLLSYFGKDSASVGFAVYVDGILQALSRMDLLEDVKEQLSVVLCDKEYISNAIRFVNEKRALDENCELFVLDDEFNASYYVDYAKANGLTDVYQVDAKGISKIY